MANKATEAGRAPRIRLGMVGGGQGAFIGGVHRIASRIDDQYELVAGVFSSDPERAAASAADLGVARSYGSFKEMAVREARRKDGVEAVAIVTPNHMHAPVAMEFLKRGIHVICDKPMTAHLAEAKRLAKAAEASGAIFALTHNYTGYPMVREAQALVAAGELGEIRLVNMEYFQDWLAEPIEETGQKQAAWRTDPAKSGAGGAVGDIGTHAWNLARFVTGLELDSLSAELTAFVPGRRLDDDAQVRLRFAGGAKGHLWASQVATGEENGLKMRIFGTKAAIEWSQENPNYLWVSPLGKPRYRLTRGGAGTGAAAARMTRIPPGHPEGYLEGFANIYAEVARAILARREDEAPDTAVTFPGIRDGVEGEAFVDACVRSSKRNGAWVRLNM